METYGPVDGPEGVLAALDPEQQEVALAARGPVCVLAGAGTGKTRAIAHRIAYGVRIGVVNPSHVLAVTPTRRTPPSPARFRYRWLRLPSPAGPIAYPNWARVPRSTRWARSPCTGSPIATSFLRLCPPTLCRERTESMVVTHTVQNSDGSYGIRWYELRALEKGDFTVFQQSTFAPTVTLAGWLASPWTR